MPPHQATTTTSATNPKGRRSISMDTFRTYFGSRSGRTFVATIFTLLLFAMLIPLANIIFIYPAFTEVLVSGVEEDAKRLGHHMMPPSIKHTKLTEKSLNQLFFGNIYKLENDYGLMKLKIFSPQGKVLYSTDSHEIGSMNTKPYFFDKVAKGYSYSKLVSKNTKSLEDKKVTRDVVETYSPYMRGNTFLGAFEMYYDVTKRKQRLDEVLSYSRIAMYALSFCLFVAAIVLFIKEISRRRAKDRAYQLKQEVESITRHDIKTPLISILNGVEFLEQFTSLTSEQIEITGDMRVAANTSMEMINRSLDLYKMESGTYRFAPVETDILAIVRRVEKALSGLSANVGTKVLCTIDGGIPSNDRELLFKTEETLFYSLVANLLKNGIEASTQGDHITINLSTTEDLQLTIHNPAVVPESIRDTFFDKFATAGKTGGTGLGTYSARLIAQTMGGAIEMTTSTEDGTLITVTLPTPIKN